MVITMAKMVEISASDLERYRALVANIDLSETQKDEVISIIRQMMIAFVDQAFGVDPTQLAVKIHRDDSFQEDSIRANYHAIPDDSLIGSNDTGIGMKEI